MALGTGSIKFSQIVNEWSETWYRGKDTPSTGNPMSMRRFLKGYPIAIASSGFGGTIYDSSGYVPNYYTTTEGIPTSGNMTMSSFKGTNAENDAYACLQGFYSNNDAHYRNITEQGYWPGVNTVANVPYNRYQGSASANYYYTDNDTLPSHSKWTTIIDWIQGAQASPTDWTGMGGISGVDPYYTWYNSSYGEMPVMVTHYRRMPRDMGGLVTEWTRLGNNSGSWSGQYLLPGKWDTYQIRIQPVTNTSNNASGPQTDYVVTVPAGMAYMLLTYSTGADGNVTGGNVPYTSNSNQILRTAHWWYNACASVFFVNQTTSAQTITFPNGLQPQYNDKGQTQWAYNSGANWFGTNYHWDFLFQRL